MLTTRNQPMAWYAALLIAAISFIGLGGPALAHCDALDGPVVVQAREALEVGEVEPVLKWVTAVDEAEVRHAFAETLAVRDLSPQAKDLADRYFFETLVRLHRASEGAAYTGLKPAGLPAVQPIGEVDQALAEGSPDELVSLITSAVEKGIRDRFAHAASAKEKADESPEAGREYVAAYVELVHYAKAIHDSAKKASHHAHAPAATHEAKHLEAHGHGGAVEAACCPSAD